MFLNSRLDLGLVRWLAGLAFTALALPASAGNVLTVGGVGGNFADIQPAVTAAANDDVILVRAGTYAGFTIDGKSLAVVGDTGAIVDVTGRVAVENVLAGGRVVLAGLRVIDTGSAQDCFFLASNVAGSVRVASCEIGRAGFTGQAFTVTQAGARIVNSPDVALTGCTLQGREGPAEQLFDIEPPRGGSGIDVQASRVSLHDCPCMGGLGGAPYGDRTGGQGGDGARVWGAASFLHASGSTFRGGNGADGHDQQDCLDFLAGDGGPGGDAIDGGHPMPVPQIVLLDQTLVVGAGGQGGFGACGPDGVDGAPGSPLDLAAGTQLSQLAGSARRMTMPVPVRESMPLTLSFSGAPGEVVRLTMWDQAGFVFLPTYNGVLLERAPLLRRINLGTVPGSGVLTATIAFPALPAGVQARLYFLQPYFLDATNTVRLGSAFGQVVLDSAF